MATGEALPDELREWVESRAAEDGVDPQRVLSRAVLVHREAERLAAAGERPEAVDIADRLDRVDELESEVQSVANRLDRVDDAVDTLGDETEDLVADVRERVIQVKREADAKAPADHDHADLRERVETAEAAAESAADAAESAANAAESVEERADGVAETVERLSTRQDTLARVAVDVRDRVQRLQRDERARAAAEDLRRAANRNGDASASCEACGETVDLALLARPRCPHCEEGLASVEPSGLFRGATLRTGDQPALTGETPLDDPLEDAVDE
jgi:predicted  nucleic acid-binding Zn-ribbon protein